MEVARKAVAALERLPPGHELAIAYCNLSHLYMSVEDGEGTVAWGTRALELAERLDDVEPLRLRAHEHRSRRAHRRRGGRRAEARAEPRPRPVGGARGARRASLRQPRLVGSARVGPMPPQTGISRPASSTAASAASICGARTCSRTAPVPSSTAAAGTTRPNPRRSCCETPAPHRSRASSRSPWSAWCARGAVIRTCGRCSTRRGLLAAETGELQRIEPAAAAQSRGRLARGRGTIRARRRRHSSSPCAGGTRG